MARQEVRVLSFHAAYRCRNSGVCCTSNWPIPVEADRLTALQASLGSGRLRTAKDGTTPAFLTPAGAPVETPALLATVNGRCVFHETDRCAVHFALGHDALPLACRQFPRVSVIDPRGVSVTLSHYCPTAANMLATVDDRTVESILLNPPSFPATGEYIGLDARGSLPPLLREGLLMDWESWWEVERVAVELLLRGPDASTALAKLRGALVVLSSWTPNDGPLIDRVRGAFREPPAVARNPVDDDDLVTPALAAVPAQFRDQARWKLTRPTGDVEARRFLAAHAFANWAIHTRAGLSGWLRSIETAHAFLNSGAGVAHTDLVLRHFANP